MTPGMKRVDRSGDISESTRIFTILIIFSEESVYLY